MTVREPVAARPRKRTGRVLISGAGIAGSALAFWLDRYGFEVTVVERAAAIRRGGREVDVKGPVQLDVLRRMGILDAVREAAVPSEDGILVDADGRTIARFPGRFAGGDINIPRGNLSHILYGLTADRCEYLFGDSLTSLEQRADGVDVAFATGAPRPFDLVIGADGIHSNVRRLAFGPEERFVQHLGYNYALVGLDVTDLHAMYNEPGRMAMIGGKTAGLFVFKSPPYPGGQDDVEGQKRFLMQAYSGAGWQVPRFMDQVPAAREFYLDAIARVTMDRYASGRVALVGDAAYANTLGGFGTGLALVAAYVLAGELHDAAGEHAAALAFTRYESKYRGYAAVSQKINAGHFMAPATRFGIRARNLLFSTMAAFEPIIKLIERPARDIRLEKYGDRRDSRGAAGD